MKKFIKKATATLAIFLSLNQVVMAQEDAGGSLGFIALLLLKLNQTTYDILAKINETPAYIQAITEMALSWIDKKDPSQTISVNGALFDLLSQSRYKDYTTGLSTAKTNTMSFLSGLPDANDMSYTTTLGEPLMDAKPEQIAASSNTYFINLSGTNSTMKQPAPDWKIGGQNKQAYYKLYSTFAAIQSFDNFVLAKMYAERLPQLKYPASIPNRSPDSPASTQDILAATIENASGANWYAQIGSESLGLVLRQILVYNSQLFILLKQILDTEQQMVMAQVMTNTILMQATSMGPGQLLYQRANS